MDTSIDTVMVIRTHFMKILKTTSERKLSFFMTDVAIFYMIMLWIVSNPVFLYMFKTIERMCRHFFLLCKFYWLFQVTNALCISSCIGSAWIFV